MRIANWKFLLFLPSGSTKPTSKSSRLVCHDDTFVPDEVLRITIDNTYPVACQKRVTAVVNGTSPGPSLRLLPDQTTWIRVYNDMPNNNLTIHWHGLSQVVAPFSDGTPQASQWPIPPMHFFDYELHPTANESGSYFYHSHVGFDANSVAGLLVVEDASESSPPYTYDEERVMFLSEYFPKSNDEIVAGLLHDPFIWSGEPYQLLVNGKSPPAVNMTTQTSSCSYETIRVEAGKTYRFRSVGAQSLSTISWAFEDHDNLTIIEVDGGYTLPAKTKHMQLGSGQRFDFLLTTKSDAELRATNKMNYWIQLQPMYRPFQPLVSFACLSYDGAGCGTPPGNTLNDTILTLPSDIYNFQEYTLEPLVPNDFPSLAEVTRRVTISAQQTLTKSTLHWNMNNNTWSETTTRQTPWLVDIYRYGQQAIPDFQVAEYNDSYVGASNVYAAQVGEVLEIVLLNEPNGLFGGFDPHPFHAHGGHFYDIGSGQGEYNATANEARIQASNYHPVKRDTTLLYKYDPGDDLDKPPYSVQGWRAWRLRVSDAGVWMIHCHTLQHMVMGMQTVWVMGNADQIVDKKLALDAQGYLQYGGNAYGNASFAPSVYHWFD